MTDVGECMKKKVYALACSVALTAIVAGVWWARRYKGPVGVAAISLGYDTTRLTSPLNPDGTVNYVAALNEKYGRGVTRENNAAAVLAEGLGADFLDPLDPGVAETLRLLGANVPEETACFFPYRPPKAPASCTSRGQPQPASGPHDPYAAALSRPWEPRELPEIDEHVRRNEAAVSVLVEAGKRPRYFIPWVSTRSPANLAGCPRPNLRTLRQLLHVLAMRAMRRIGEGQLDRAWSDTMVINRMANLLGQDLVLISRLLALIARGMGAAPIRHVAASPRLTAEMAGKYLADLNRLPDLPDLTESFELQRYISVDAAVLLARASKKPIDWSRILRRVNQAWDKQAAILAARDYAGRKAASADADKFAEQWSGKKPGWLATDTDKEEWAFLSIILTTFRGMAEAWDADAMALRLDPLPLALAAYRLDHGAYPRAIGDLVPEYAQRVPSDFYSGRPIIYRRAKKGYVLYSVGPNTRDDAGRCDDAGERDDIVVEVNR